MKHTVEQHRNWCDCRCLPGCNHCWESEKTALFTCEDDFIKTMNKKLHEKILEGRSSWDDKNWSKEDKIKQIVEHAMRGDFIDVANIAMFGWNQEQPDKEGGA